MIYELFCKLTDALGWTRPADRYGDQGEFVLSATLSAAKFDVMFLSYLFIALSTVIDSGESDDGVGFCPVLEAAGQSPVPNLKDAFTAHGLAPQ